LGIAAVERLWRPIDNSLFAFTVFIWWATCIAWTKMGTPGSLL